MERFDIKRLGKAKDYIPFSSRLLKGFAKDNFCVISKGKGMMPRINDGDMLLCSVCTKFKNGDIVLLWDGKGLHCKFRLVSKDVVIYQNAKQELFNAKDCEIVGIVLSKFALI